MTESKTRQDRDFYRGVYEQGGAPWSNLTRLDRRTDHWIDALYIPDSSRVLDLGTGRGRIAERFQSAGYEAYGIDYLREPLLDARDRSVSRVNRFLQADAFEPPFPSRSFSCLVDYGLLHHVRESGWPSYRREVLSLLQLGGYFFVNVFHTSDEHAERRDQNWVYHRNHYDHFFTRESLDEVLGESFSRVEDGMIEDGEHRFLHALYRKSV